MISEGAADAFPAQGWWRKSRKSANLGVLGPARDMRNSTQTCILKQSLKEARPDASESRPKNNSGSVMGFGNSLKS
jgi:hypothetical protein